MLLEYLPDYYKDSKVFKALLHAFVKEINTNNYSIAELEDQLFIDTATWGLDVWERELQIYTDLRKTYEERREIIKAKMRGSGTCTIEMIKNTALAYTNAEVEIIEDNANYTFAVKFVSVKGVPKDIESFKDTLERIKPAHLAYTLEYTYTIWGDLSGMTWDELADKTWQEAKTV